jgi:hypothetical protein
MLSGMFVRYYADLARPFADVEAPLLDDPERWLPAIFEAAEDRGSRLMADVGFSVGRDHRVDKQVEVHIGDPYRMSGKTTVPITWSASGAERLFPSLEGDLEIAAVGERRSQLSISARYKPPLGVLGRVVDRALMHRIAEATLKDFLDRVVEVLGAPTHVPAS